jgi:S-adenosylmethionine:tRNA ribosyltransferase-isomerase
MRTSSFDFNLPAELIAQTPASERDQSRLLVLHCQTGQLEHRCFRDVPDYLRAGDVLVLNNSRVIPARLRGINFRTGGQFEILLLNENALNDWWVMIRPGKRARVGTEIVLRDSQGTQTSVSATVIEQNAEGHRRLRFGGEQNISSLLDQLGEVPLPPYITREPGQGWGEDRERYQTVFAERPGSVAAPTAGLHFTAGLLDKLRARGVNVCFITLHVGLGTFAPVKSERISAHQMHEEHFRVGEETIRIINEAKRDGRRIIAVGTTTVRVLETLAYTSPLPARDVAALSTGPSAASTRLFIHPPYEFRIVDALITNFHLPRSSLLMLVSAFAAPGQTCGRETILNAYAEAIRRRYRFFSYGDAMLLL